MSLCCFKIISDQAPIYLSDLPHLYIPSRQLHFFADTRVIRISSFHTKSSSHCSFSYQPQTSRNQHPVSVDYATSVSMTVVQIFLKHFLFSVTFSSVPLPCDTYTCIHVYVWVPGCVSVLVNVCVFEHVIYCPKMCVELEELVST